MHSVKFSPGLAFRKRLPDREIDLYPIRAFTAILHPHRDLLLRGAPGPQELTASHIDGSGMRAFVFRSSRGGSVDLYLMNADGTSVRRLTNDAANDLFPNQSSLAARATARCMRCASKMA